MSAAMKTETIGERLRSLRDQLAEAERGVNSFAWDTEVKTVVALTAKREALSLLIKLCEREQKHDVAREHESFLRVQADAARRAREKAERHKWAVEAVVSLDEEIVLFSTTYPDLSKQIPHENELHRRLKTWLWTPIHERVPAAQKLMDDINKDGLKPFIEHLRAQREKTRSEFDVSDAEIAACAEWVVAERERLLPLISRGVMQLIHSPVVGVDVGKVPFDAEVMK
jgi:galactokinase